MPGAISSSELYSMFSSAASDESEIPPNLPAVAMPSTSATPGEISPSEIFIMLSSTSISDEDADKTMVEKPLTPAAAVPRISMRQIRRKTKAHALTSSAASGKTLPAGSTINITIRIKKKKMRSDNVCHPKGFQEEKVTRPQRRIDLDENQTLCRKSISLGVLVGQPGLQVDSEKPIQISM